MTTPYSWHSPPLLDPLILPDGSAFHTDPERSWCRAPWSVEAGTATLSALLPGWADIFLTVQVKAHSATPMTPSIVRTALRLLRFEQPVIATKVAFREAPVGSPVPVGDGVVVYEVPSSETDVDDWLSDVVTDRTDALDAAGGELGEAIKVVRREVSKALPVYPPGQLDVSCIPTQGDRAGALVLRCGHVVFDAAGTFETMHLLLRTIAKVIGAGDAARQPIAWGDEIQRLMPSVVELTHVPWSPGGGERNSLIGRKYSSRLQRFADGDPPTLHTPHPDAAPTYTGTFHRELQDDVLQSLVRAARAHGCTLFTTAYAAGLLSALKVNPPAKSDQLVTFQWIAPVNLRFKGVLTRDTSVPSALSGYILEPESLGRFVRNGRVPALEDVWTLAREMNAQMNEQSSETKNIARWGEAFEYTTLPAELLKKLAEKDTSRISNPWIVSLGVMDRYLSPSYGEVGVSQPGLQVRNCYAVPPVGPLVAAHIYTWQNTLYVNVCYPESVVGTHEEQEAAIRDDKKARGSLLAWTNAFMDTLRAASGQF